MLVIWCRLILPAFGLRRDDGYVGSGFAGRIADLTYTTRWGSGNHGNNRILLWPVGKSVLSIRFFNKIDFNISTCLDEEASASKSLKEEINLNGLLSLYGRSAIINVRFGGKKLKTRTIRQVTRLTRSNIPVKHWTGSLAWSLDYQAISSLEMVL